MNLPLFYIPTFDPLQREIDLDEETSRHIIQVLRMKPQAQVNLTDGKGNLLTAEIISDHKRHCRIRIIHSQFMPRDSRKVTIAISLLKNTNRFEWFLEKATEIGIAEIIPLLCQRTEKEKFRHDRMQQICISAMLQSQQAWLPLLHQPIAFDLLFRQEELAQVEQKFIAHCEKETSRSSISHFHPIPSSTIILIGPEGDFTNAEIELALTHGFIPVYLGEKRLRTETAGVVAATLLMLS